jgi:hypothetical protein
MIKSGTSENEIINLLENEISKSIDHAKSLIKI